MTRSLSKRFHLLLLLALLLLKPENPRASRQHVSSTHLHFLTRHWLLVSLSLLSYLTSCLTRDTLQSTIILSALGWFFLSLLLDPGARQKLHIYTIFLHNPVSRSSRQYLEKNYSICETAIGIRASSNHRCDFKENQTSILSLGTARASTMSNSDCWLRLVHHDWPWPRRVCLRSLSRVCVCV